MYVFKWLNSLTIDLFVTAERPIILIVNQTKNENFSNHVCRIFSLLGADVVSLTDLRSKAFSFLNCFDGIIYISEKSDKIAISICKPHAGAKKTRKKTFSHKDFHLTKNYI